MREFLSAFWSMLITFVRGTAKFFGAYEAVADVTKEAAESFRDEERIKNHDKREKAKQQLAALSKAKTGTQPARSTSRNTRKSASA